MDAKESPTESSLLGENTSVDAVDVRRPCSTTGTTNGRSEQVRPSYVCSVIWWQGVQTLSGLPMPWLFTDSALVCWAFVVTKAVWQPQLRKLTSTISEFWRPWRHRYHIAPKPNVATLGHEILDYVTVLEFTSSLCSKLALLDSFVASICVSRLQSSGSRILVLACRQNYRVSCHWFLLKHFQMILKPCWTWSC